MVKNTHGGSGHKSQARKNTINPKQFSSKIRLRNTEDDEVYAQVLKILGGGMCAILCHDDIERLCVIRGKFRGRGKRDNTLYAGGWILVGLRTWAAASNKGKELCDLLEIYSETDKKKLQTLELSINWNNFITNTSTDKKEVIIDQNEFDFSDEQPNEEYKDLFSTTNNTKMTFIAMEEEEIDVSDI